MSKRQSVIDEGFEAGGMAAAKVGLAFTVAGIKQFCARSLSRSLFLPASFRVLSYSTRHWCTARSNNPAHAPAATPTAALSTLRVLTYTILPLSKT